MKNLELFLLQTASQAFTTDTLPDNWFELSKQDQEQWLEEHAWEPLEYRDVSTVYELIDCMAHTIKCAMKDILNAELKEGRQNIVKLLKELERIE